MQQENSKPVLYQGKAFTTWKQAFETIESWAKQQGFNIIYSRVKKKSDGIFRRRIVQCEHHEPTSKNPFKYVYITTGPRLLLRYVTGRNFTFI
ncbi:hypothetical protein RhiirA4_551076 [Rhizophagus irregularis]|uniref:Uncharacterized protein n=1 Tax=Rhizophagus irregularis TaxID=588596 RepID=A0A2I1HSU4_9GLOM|nr:hypothetical protein RhiirA4_551076 [Rhizophagus irregularis]